MCCRDDSGCKGREVEGIREFSYTVNDVVMAMSIKNKFTREQVIAALKATGGFITHAADELGCSYRTIENYIKQDPSIAVENAHIQENRLDIAESVVIQTMEGSDKKVALDASKFYLKYKGRQRGYIKAQKLEISEDLTEMMKDAEERTA